jgi:prophage regulatory protein
MSPSSSSDSVVPRMINVREVASILSLSTRSVWRLVAKGELPKPARFGRSARWRLADIEACIEARSNPNHGASARRSR